MQRKGHSKKIETSMATFPAGLQFTFELYQEEKQQTGRCLDPILPPCFAGTSTGTRLRLKCFWCARGVLKSKNRGRGSLAHLVYIYGIWTFCLLFTWLHHLSPPTHVTNKYTYSIRLEFEFLELCASRLNDLDKVWLERSSTNKKAIDVRLLCQLLCISSSHRS